MSNNKKMILSLLCAISLSGVVTVASAMEPKTISTKVNSKNNPVLRKEEWTPQAKEVLAAAQIQNQPHLTHLGKQVKDAEKKHLQPVGLDLTPTAGDYLAVGKPKTGKFTPRVIVKNDGDAAAKKALTEARAQKIEDEKNTYKALENSVLKARQDTIAKADEFELFVEVDKPRSSKKPSSRKPKTTLQLETIENSFSSPMAESFETPEELVLPKAPKLTVKPALEKPKSQPRNIVKVKKAAPSGNIVTWEKRQQLAEEAAELANAGDSPFKTQWFITPDPSPVKEKSAPFSALRPAMLRDREEDERMDARTTATIAHAQYSDKTVDARFLRDFTDRK